MYDSNVVKQQADQADIELAAKQGEIDARNADIQLLETKTTKLSNENGQLKDELLVKNATIADLQAQLVALSPLKPAMAGLITTDPAYFSKIPYAEFGGEKFMWDALNPSKGSYNFSAIDSMLKAYPNKKFRIRIMAGVNAPGWLKTQVGTIAHVPDGPNGRPGDVPKYWNENYYGEWFDFMQALANRYESNPQVVDIPLNYTTTIFAEPFILAADGATIDKYWQAGLNFDKHDLYLRKSLDSLMSLFPTTRISLAGHGKWQYIVQGTSATDGVLKSSWELERTFINNARAAYGEHLVLDDHGLGPDDAVGIPQSSDTATSWYNYLAGLKGTEQSYGLQFTLNGGSMVTAADAGVKMGACTLEYAAFEALRTAGIDRQTHDKLLANAAGKP